MCTAWVRQPFVVCAVAGAGLVATAFATPALVPGDDPADAVTRQTARVAVLFWGVAAAQLLIHDRAWGRAAWTVGAATFLIHVATAFDRVHHWSHDAAVLHVETVSGFGPGLFASYAFTLLWTADAAWWWIDGPGYDRRPAWLDRTIHGFIAFVVFNGTVVYETGFIRWVSVVLFAVLGVLFLRRALAASVARR